MRTILAAILLFMASQVATEQALRLVLDFATPEAAQKWQAVNDGVMGGVSDGRFRITDAGTLEFFGTLSLVDGCQKVRQAGARCWFLGEISDSLSVEPLR